MTGYGKEKENEDGYWVSIATTEYFRLPMSAQSLDPAPCLLDSRYFLWSIPYSHCSRWAFSREKGARILWERRASVRFSFPLLLHTSKVLRSSVSSCSNRTSNIHLVLRQSISHAHVAKQGMCKHISKPYHIWLPVQNRKRLQAKSYGVYEVTWSYRIEFLRFRLKSLHPHDPDPDERA
jgi:hypothetical protein